MNEAAHLTEHVSSSGGNSHSAARDFPHILCTRKVH